VIIECNSDEFHVIIRDYPNHRRIRIRHRPKQGYTSQRIVKDTMQNTITLCMDEWDLGINATVVKVKL
jgi:hypothetical protein